MLIRFSHVMVYSLKHAEAVKWYCETLGFEVDYNALDAYASLQHKLLGRLAIHATDDARQIGGGPMPYLLCEDIEDTLSGLKAKGVRVSEPRREGESPRFAHFWDLDGNEWGMEEV